MQAIAPSAETVRPRRAATAGDLRRRRLGYLWRTLGLLGAALLVYWMMLASGLVVLFSGSGEALQAALSSLGAGGPWLLILLMVLAVVFSPLPSAPIALAAGALYGHGWGTLYVLVGAEIGALLAFGIARYLCPLRLAARLEIWFGEHLSFLTLGSQQTLMLAVCTSRLLPFVSFDLASYAAGLTPLTVWRFALATLVGVLPASFVLVHLGGELGSFEIERVAFSLLLLGILTATSLLLGRRRPTR